MEGLPAEALEFSDTIAFSGPPPVLSPDGRLVALAQGVKLVLKTVDTLKVIGLFTCLDRIETVQWSSTGEHILCAQYKRGTVQVFSVNDQEWSCSITEGLAGVVHARWCPDGQHVLLIADFRIKMSIWSLVDQSCVNLPGPKHADSGLAFSPDGSMLAVLERLDCADYLHFYAMARYDENRNDLNNSLTEQQNKSSSRPGMYSSYRKVKLPTTDAIDLSWSPDTSCVAAWDSAAQGHTIAIVTPYRNGVDSCIIASYKVPCQGLGIKSVSWSPSGQLLGIGVYETPAATILNNATWTSLASLTHPSTILRPSSTRTTPLTVYRGPGVVLDSASTAQLNPLSPSSSLDLTEVASSFDTLSLDAVNASPSNNSSRSIQDQQSYTIATLPIRVPMIKPPPDRPNPKMGVGLLAWSADGHYLATRSDDRSHTLWIWDVTRLELTSILIHASPIKSVTWDPTGAPRCAIACSSCSLAVWTPYGASYMSLSTLSPSLKVSMVRWSGDGKTVILSDRKETAFLARFAPWSSSRDNDM